MLSISLKGYTRACAPTTGGLSRIWVYDPADFEYTTGTSVNSYASVARRTGATSVGGAKMFPINFTQDEANRKSTQKAAGCSNAYDHEITAQLPQLSQLLTDFLGTLASAGCCSGLGLVIEHNDGKLFVAGEKYVNGATIPRFTIKMDGTTTDSGKVFTDFNGANVVFKGTYSRELNEFTGGVASIEAFEV